MTAATPSYFPNASSTRDGARNFDVVRMIVSLNFHPPLVSILLLLLFRGRSNEPSFASLPETNVEEESFSLRRRRGLRDSSNHLVNAFSLSISSQDTTNFISASPLPLLHLRVYASTHSTSKTHRLRASLNHLVDDDVVTCVQSSADEATNFIFLAPVHSSISSLRPNSIEPSIEA